MVTDDDISTLIKIQGHLTAITELSDDRQIANAVSGVRAAALHHLAPVSSSLVSSDGLIHTVADLYSGLPEVALE